ncbi:MAG: succinylglutamate desuccinylase/aspartoacylase family protein [Aureispira sp.]
MQEAIISTNFNINDTPPESICHYWIDLITDGLGAAIRLPVMVARGKEDFPVLGVTAAVHGNELNGIPVIQRLFNEIDPSELKGIIVAIPVVNIPSYVRRKRRFNDGVDLNHIMPGKENGNISQVYAYRFFEKFVRHMDYLLDLHTASAGRINTYYVRADMKHPVTRKLALLQNAQIIVHNPPSDGTLRGAADAIDIPAITLEVGNPNTFQKKMIKSGMIGVHNVLSYLEMIEEPIEEPLAPTVICQRSYWIYTDVGGLLTLHVDLMREVEKGTLLASIRDVFGNLVKQYHAPEVGIVIGKSVSPVNQAGGRILHLGIKR